MVRYDVSSLYNDSTIDIFPFFIYFCIGPYMCDFSRSFFRGIDVKAKTKQTPGAEVREQLLERREDDAAHGDQEGVAGRSAKFRQNIARFRLYRHRFLQENMRFAAFFKICQIIKLKFLKFGKIKKICKIICKISLNLLKFNFHKNC